jgi:hypothetical protein
MLDALLDPIFSLIGGAKQLPLYLFLLPIPILLWLFWAEFHAATGRDTPVAERALHFVDGLNSAIGKTYGWCHPDIYDQLRGLCPLHFRSADRVGVRCELHALRHAVHDGRRLCARPQRPCAW